MTNHRGDLEGQLGRRPTLAELAAGLGLEEARITEILRHATGPLSLSEPLGEDGDREFGDILEDRSAVSPFDAAAAALLSVEVDKMLVALDVREREVLRLRFGLDRGQPRSLDQVGAQLQPLPGAYPPDRGSGLIQAAPGLDRPRPLRAADQLGPHPAGARLSPRPTARRRREELTR